MAHSSSSSLGNGREGVRQYDLWINGVHFSQLLTLSELIRRQRKETRIKAIESKPDDAVLRRIESSHSLESDTSLDIPNEIGVLSSSSSCSFRLAMAGYQTDSADDDELRSELYSSALDEVRLSMTSFLPQTEEMISRAIMDVFISSEDDTGHSSSSSSLYVPRDEECCHLEVNALYETLEWIRLQDSKDDAWDEELVLAFLQKQIMGTIRQIRNEQISSQIAIRILVGVASLLELPFVRPMVQDTVLVEDDCRGIDSAELRRFLSRFGVVEWCSVSKLNPSFACCRFGNEGSLMNLFEAVRDNKIPVNLSHMSFTALSNSARSRSTTSDSSSSERDVSQGTKVEKPHLIKSISHDQQTASSTCASPQSQCSILDFSHFVLG